MQDKASVEISVTPFKFKHYKDLISLLESQKYPDIESIKMKTLPKIGYIAYYGKQPVAAGFLRKVEPFYAQIDTLVSCGYFGSQIRHEGIKITVDSLVLEAKRLKIQGILAFTADSGILKRAQSIGFKIISQTLIGLNLDDYGHFD